MVERLPKQCSVVIDNLERALGEDVKLGVCVSCTRGGKNKFDLMFQEKKTLPFMPDMNGFLKFDYHFISIPALNALLSAKYPDFILKPTEFMPLCKLVNELGLDAEQLAVEVLKSIRATLKRALRDYYNQKEGAALYKYTCSGSSWSESSRQKISQKFKSFHEFLIWVDLNVNSQFKD